MNAPGRPKSRPRRQPDRASGEFLLLAEWECSVIWLLQHTERWPKNVRASLTQRFENAALELLELLVRARYDRTRRAEALGEANHLLERLRYLSRIAHARHIFSNSQFEATIRRLDAEGRMIFGWRRSLCGPEPQGSSDDPAEATL
jgi:hypothetical protein